MHVKGLPRKFSDVVFATEGSGPTAAAAIGAAALLAIVPLASPLVQIWLLARKSKDDIEDTVRVKEPLQACAVSC